MPSDEEVSAARAKLAAMRQSLAGLKQHQARLEMVCQKAKDTKWCMFFLIFGWFSGSLDMFVLYADMRLLAG